MEQNLQIVKMGAELKENYCNLPAECPYINRGSDGIWPIDVNQGDLFG